MSKQTFDLSEALRRMRQVFGKQHYEVIAKAAELARTPEVHRLMVVSMFYNKNLENYKNVTEHFDSQDGKFILTGKYKENVL